LIADIIHLCECGCGGSTTQVTRNIGREGVKKGEYRRFIKCHHNRVLKLGYKGGQLKHHGYVYIYAPNHPRPTQAKYIKRSRLVVEERLGRHLESWEHVHHVNGVRDDDRPENLELTTLSKHNRTHDKASKMLSARWRKK